MQRRKDMLHEATMKRTWFFAATVSLLLCFFSTAQAEMQMQFAGRVCLHLAGADSLTGPLQLDIMSYGTDTFPVFGKVPNGPSGPIPLHGTAIVDGNTASITLNASKDPVVSATYSIELNLKTLSGTYTLLQSRRQVMTEYPYEYSTSFSSDAVTLSACP